ncbi:haloacid dehalogenase-like hydrolase [Blastococcus sp. SYSU D01042]
MRAGRDTVVFDLDGTLVAGDAFGLFLRRLLTRSPLRLAAALVSAPLWVPAMAFRTARVVGERYLVWLALVGADERAFTAAVRDFAEEHAGPGGGRAAVAGVQQLREHLERGDRVVVATGCAAPLAEEVCAVLRLPEVEVVGTRLVRGRWGLPERTVPARGEGKLRALEAAGVCFPVAHAYSDSPSDLPLLRNALVPHVVDPAPRDLVRLRRALGDDVDVLRWAGRGG